MTILFLVDRRLLFSRRAVVSYWVKYVHEVLVNRLGGLSLPRKSVVRLTDRPDMTLDVYCGHKTTMQQRRVLDYNFVCDNKYPGTIIQYKFYGNQPYAGLPRSGKNIWKMKFFQGQGKVREFCGWPGKFRKDLESQGKVREFENKWLWQAVFRKFIYSVQEGKGCTCTFS